MDEEAMRKAVPLLILLIVLATALLAIVTSWIITTASVPSPFLIAATIVSTVALLGAVFSLYAGRRTKNRLQQNSLSRKR